MQFIKTIDQFNEKDKMVIVEQIKDIFFQSSSVKNFDSEDHKNTFFKRWCGDYITYYPESFYLCFDEGENSKKLLGYLSGCLNSLLALNVLNVPAQRTFESQFIDYPAHLHINFHPDARGKGLGSVLVNHFCGQLKNSGIKGVHLVTSPDAKNVSFYHRLGFTNEVRQLNGKSALLFMGKIIY